MGLVAPTAWSSAWALRRKRGKHVPFSSSMWQLADLSWFGETIVLYMTAPSLWKPGAELMTIVDFLSIWSSPGFPFCGHHTLALRGNQCPGMGDLARTWYPHLSFSSHHCDASHDLLFSGSLAKWVVLKGIAGSAALAQPPSMIPTLPGDNAGLFPPPVP